MQKLPAFAQHHEVGEINPIEELPIRGLGEMAKEYGAVHFSVKFNRQKLKTEKKRETGGFEIGEKVAATFLVQEVHAKDGTIDKSKIRLLVDESLSGDVRQSDDFIVAVSEDEWNNAQNFAGMPFNGVVEVSSKGEYCISNMFTYEAGVTHLECVVPVNPKSVEGLKLDSSVLVEGKIISFDVTEHWEDGDKAPKKAIIKVETPNGDIVKVKVDSNIVFEPSMAQENIRGKHPEIGDTVRIKSSVVKYEKSDRKALGAAGAPYPDTEDLLAPMQGDKTKELYAPWCRSAYLLQPNEERAAEYGALRESVTKEVKAINGAIKISNYTEARTVIGRLMKQEVSAAERAELEVIVSQIPEAEQPLMLFKNRNEANDIVKSYGADIDVMTKAEFYEFCKAEVQTLFRGTKRNKAGSHDYIYRVMEHINMPEEQRIEIMQMAARTRLDHLKTREAGSYQNDYDFSDVYMLGRSVQYMGVMAESVATVDTYFELLEEIMDSDWSAEIMDASSGSTAMAKSEIPEVKQALEGHIARLMPRIKAAMEDEKRGKYSMWLGGLRNTAHILKINLDEKIEG